MATENASASPHRPGDPEPFPRPAEVLVCPRCLRSELSLHLLPRPWPGCPLPSCSDHSSEGRGSNPASTSLHPAGHQARICTISCSKAPMPGKAKRRLLCSGCELRAHVNSQADRGPSTAAGGRTRPLVGGSVCTGGQRNKTDTLSPLAESMAPQITCG